MPESSARGTRAAASRRRAAEIKSLQRTMEVAEKHSSSGYALGPPWLFKGSAFYQLHLVKAETARAFIPKNLRLVEAFGYTLGGFFLAHYDDSPAGMFDELVVIAGIVWNPPTSCAWAARVLVSSHDACRHGRKEIGLPSHVGIFSKRAVEIPEKQINKWRGFLDMIGMGSDSCNPKEQNEIRVSEIKDSSPMSLCNIDLPVVVPKSERSNKWTGLTIRMLLPSFSGQTMYNPHLLKYSCQIDCSVRPVEAAKVRGPTKIGPSKRLCGQKSDDEVLNASTSPEDDAWDQSISVLLSKPVLALEFNHLKMQVDMPTIVDL